MKDLKLIIFILMIAVAIATLCELLIYGLSYLVLVPIGLYVTIKFLTIKLVKALRNKTNLSTYSGRIKIKKYNDIINVINGYKTN